MAAVNVSMTPEFSAVAATTAGISVASSVKVSAAATISAVADSTGLVVVSAMKVSASGSFSVNSTASVIAPSLVKASASTGFDVIGHASALRLAESSKVSVLASFDTSATATGIETSGNVAIAANPQFSCLTSSNLVGSTEDDAMTLCGVVDHVLSMWGILCRRSAPRYAIERAITDVNHALQLVWNNAEERNYWTNQTLTVTFATGEDSKDLPNYVQNVTGPCRLSANKQPLTPIGSIGELETFDDVYLDGVSYDVPVAYHIERMNQSGDDPAKCVFRLNMAVTETTDFDIEIIREAPRFQVSDLETCPVVPIPHRYIESLILPIACYQASTYYLFRNEDRREALKSEYLKAMMSLGLADPLPGDSGDNKPPATKS